MKFRMSMLFNFSLLLVVVVVYGNYLHSHSSAAAGAAFDQFVKCLNHGVVQVRGDFWNDGGLIRFSHPLLNTPNSLVVEIGGNAGRDSLEFLTRYKSIDYFTLEPMPDYIKILNSKLVDTKLIPADHILQYGVDRLDGNFTFCEDGNLGEATSAFRIPKTCKQSLVLPVRRGSDALKEIMKVAGKDEIDLLTMNCEGCEYGFFESLIEENMLKKIKIIQYARHPINTIPNLLARSCRIQEHLAVSHYVKYEYQFLWEAWYRHQQTHQ